MDPHEYEVMARAEESHPWFVNRRRLVRGLVRRFARHLSRPRVLDAGSGTGVNLTDYETFGWTVGVELDKPAAAISVRRGHCRTVVGDVCRLPFCDASFDLLISTDVIEHVVDDVAALREMARVLAPAGRLVLTTPAYSWAYSNHDRCLHHVRRYDRRRLRAAFDRSGLLLIHSGRYNVLLAGPVLLSRMVCRHGGRSDVGRPIPRLLAPALDMLWHIEARLAERLDLQAGLTHVAVLAHAE